MSAGWAIIQASVEYRTLGWVAFALVALIFFAQYGGQIARGKGAAAGVPLAIGSILTSILAVLGITNGWIIWSFSSLANLDPAAFASITAYSLALGNAANVINLSLTQTVAVVGIVFMGLWVAHIFYTGKYEG